MIVRVWLHSGLLDEESNVYLEMKDNATVNDIDREVSRIAEQHYANKAEWEIVDNQK